MTVRTLNDADDAASETASATDGETRQSTREELGRFADQGGFTLNHETNPWLEAAETLNGPEDARAASTVLAELRSRDTRAVGKAASAIADKAGLSVPDTLGGLTTLLDLLQRVHATSAVLRTDAYQHDLDQLAAATGTSGYRKYEGIKLGWNRRRVLRGQARALTPAGTRAPGRAELHSALVAAAAAHRDWLALAADAAAGSSRPSVPVDGALLTETANVVESLADAVRSLTRLLPERALDSLPLGELADLVDRLAADEGTLYRLSALRQLRLELAEQGLTELLDELTERQADKDAALAAYDRHQSARAALAAGPRQATDETADAEAPVEEPAAEVEPEPELVVEAVVETAAEAEVEQADAEVEVEAVTEAPAEVVAEEEAAAEVAVEAEAVAEVEAEVAVEPEAEPVAEQADIEVEAPAEVVAEAEAEVAAAAEVESETAAEAVVEPVVEVEAEPAVEAEAVVEPVAEVVEEPEVEVESGPVAEAVAESVVEAELVVETAAEAEVVAEAEAEVAAEPEVESVVEVEPEAVVEAEAVVEPVAEVVEEPAAEVEAEPTVEAAVEPEVAAEPEAEAEAEPEAAVEAEPVVEVEAEPEPVVEAVAEPVVEVEAEPAAEPVAEVVEEPAAEVEPEPVVEAEPEVAAEPEAEAVVEAVAVAAPVKPELTPGKPITGYSAEELVALVAWFDADGTERSDDELLRAAMKELGFARLGPRIKEALGAAVASVRS
ncbi:hypothetical protein [Kitasatospora griseola]|uniref:hypothetical protein n=1 Tax=Kitasatospora griseola TaxID=2064 RepID=UPI00380E92EC